MLLRWPEDVRRVREHKRSALPSGPEYQICLTAYFIQKIALPLYLMAYLVGPRFALNSSNDAN
jgi:hypothetical protein